MSERADLRKMLEADHAYAVEFALAQCESMGEVSAIKDARIVELEQQAALWKAEYEAARDCYDEQEVEIANLKGLLRKVMERWGMYRFAVEGYESEKNLLSRIDSALSDKGDVK